MTGSPIVIEVSAWDGRLRAATGGGWQAGASDPAPYSFWPARLLDAGSIGRAMVDPAVGGAEPSTSTTWGAVRLANADNALNAMMEWSFCAARIEWFRPRGNNRGAAILRGSVDAVGWPDRTMELTISDRLAACLDRPVQPLIYAGDAVGPTGLEGGADLRGQSKPLLVGGPAKWLPIPAVNTSTLIYQVSVSEASITGVWDRGVALALEPSPRASLAALQATAPVGGGVAWYSGPEGCYLRCGSIPAGTITCDAAAPSGRAAATAIAQLLASGEPQLAIPVSAISIDPGVGSTPAAWWSGTRSRTVREAVVELARAARLAVIATRSGDVRITSLALPRAPHTTIRADQVLRDPPPQRLATVDDTPAWRVTVQWARNHWPAGAGDLAGAALGDRLVREQEWRSISASAPERLQRWPRARDLVIASPLVSEADATALCTAHLALFREPRRMVELAVDRDVAETLDLGDAVAVDLAGLDHRVWTVVALTERFAGAGAGGTTQITLWG